MTLAAKQPTTFSFCGYDCILVTSEYADNQRLAVKVVSAETEGNALLDTFPGEPMGSLSINVTSGGVSDGEFAAKNIRENEGLLESAIDAGLVELTNKVTICGFPIARLT